MLKIIRCKECVYFENDNLRMDGKIYDWCEYHANWLDMESGEAFCAWAKKKENPRKYFLIEEETC